MTNIKCIFPGEVYSKRTIKVKNGNDEWSLSKSHNENPLQINDVKGELTFKLDYHKTTISLKKEVDEDKYLIVNFKTSGGLLGFIQLLFTNCLHVSEVTKQQFEEPLKFLTITNAKKYIKPNLIRIISIIFHLCVYFYFIYISLSQEKISDFDSLVFYLSLFSSFGLITVFNKKFKLNVSKYKYRVFFSTLTIFIFLIIYSGIETRTEWFLLIVSFVILVANFNYIFFKRLKSQKQSS